MDGGRKADDEDCEGVRNRELNREAEINMQAVMFLSNPFISDPRVYAEAKSLIQAGHEVTVIAWDREKQNPPRQNWDGIDVVRLRTRLLPKRYHFGSPFWVGPNLLLWQRQAFRMASLLNKEKRFDVIHCHDLDTLAIGIGLYPLTTYRARTLLQYEGKPLMPLR